MKENLILIAIRRIIFLLQKNLKDLYHGQIQICCIIQDGEVVRIKVMKEEQEKITD